MSDELLKRIPIDVLTLDHTVFNAELAPAVQVKGFIVGKYDGLSREQLVELLEKRDREKKLDTSNNRQFRWA